VNKMTASKVELCDACLLAKPCLEHVDVEMAEDGVDYLQLCPHCRVHMDRRTLQSHAWLALVLRITAQHPLLDGQWYSALGVSYQFRGSLRDNATAEVLEGIRVDLNVLCQYGICCEGVDIDLGTLGSSWSEAIAMHHDSRTVLPIVEEHFSRDRCAEEVTTNALLFLNTARVDVSPDWLRDQWQKLGTEHASALRKLSVRFLDRDELDRWSAEFGD
jgi:hypothetical protein